MESDQTNQEVTHQAGEQAPMSEGSSVGQTDMASMTGIDMDTNIEGSENKTLSMIGYVIPLLFFLPLLSKGSGQFSKFHANQQLVILIIFFASYFVSLYLPVAHLIVLILWLIAMVMGVVSVSRGKMKPLPLIGKIHILN